MKIVYDKKTNKILMALKNDGQVSGVHVEYGVVYLPENTLIRDSENYISINDINIKDNEIQKYGAKVNLQQTDTYMSRVTEDIIDLLISKGIILSTDLPDDVHTKINKRKGYRDIIKEEEKRT